MLPLNTVTVGAAVAPEVVGTWFSHYLNRKPLRQKPTAHIGYDLGLHLVRRFIQFSALHPVEELQAFTSQRVPVPHWVKCDRFKIPQDKISEAAGILQKNLGPHGIDQVGGKEWWQWRRENAPLEAEWIEMRSDYLERKANNEKGRRVLLYIHGGAYYFGSTDEHRYQIQRHARKLKARCLAPRYRLAPQFPFPCGLHDCLSAYLHLLTEYEASSIVVAGDSAGGGMVLAMLVVLRDQGIPLPAGGMLLSPWVDLMHSFPSIGGDGVQDYIPATGFIHKPSMSWPPPTLEEVSIVDGPMPDGNAAAPTTNDEGSEGKEGDTTDQTLVSQEMAQGVSIDTNRADEGSERQYRSNMSGIIQPAQHLPWVVVDGKHVQIRDQIQLYAPNHLLNHPLVSPVLQPSLGGLCPLLIQAGGGEMLRDEQVYLGHKAANPEKYLPSEALLDIHDPDRTKIHKYPPTDVQLQVWDDLCHVPHTLAWTRPAKYMYRSVAQFGAWALAHAQQRAIDIPEDDTSDSDSDECPDDLPTGQPAERNRTRRSEVVSDMHTTAHIQSKEAVGKAGDPLPPFKNHMIRQRLDRHGNIYPMAAESELPELHMHRDDIGTLKPAPVRKWLGRQAAWNKKFASTKVAMQKKRAKQLEKGYVGIPEGERPPPTALAGRRPADMPKVAKVKKSWGLSMWSGWGSKHDQVREQRSGSVSQPQTNDEEQSESSAVRPVSRRQASRTHSRSHSRSSSRSFRPGHQRTTSGVRSVTDEGQTGTIINQHLAAPSAGADGLLHPDSATPRPQSPAAAGTVIPPSKNGATTRPQHDGIAYPFKLKVDGDEAENHKSKNPSIVTLDGGDAVSAANGKTNGVEDALDELSGVETGEKTEGRPGAERFYTAVNQLG
ncbi:hypothetical protein FKW77_005509 [Venturia effusa]|uniref:Alpha/beta hydrolase fold-3 domain-containing protein n=1 Tax=Venturia effusa TaxID=50376 RepID=A0A517L9B7_9PEZI|nr:hypothetical protein FKW77_005509 [Venturia effusa]